MFNLLKKMIGTQVKFIVFETGRFFPVDSIPVLWEKLLFKIDVCIYFQPKTVLTLGDSETMGMKKSAFDLNRRS